MKNNTKILAVEDELMFQEILSAIFSGYQFTVVDNGEEGLKLAHDLKPDLILLDINLPGIDGYQTCAQLKDDSLTQEIPVLFLSQYHALEDRLKAYGVGGIDYISKPFEKSEVLAKVAQHIAAKKQRDDLAKELKESYDVVLDMQLENADIQIIGRFLQANLFCRDFESLLELFFRTTQELGVSCVLQIRSGDERLIRSDVGETHLLEEDILKMTDNMERILSFGKDRALFNWEFANLLVRNLGSRIDLLAILMNGLDASIKAIISEQNLLTMVSKLELQNSILKDEISDLFNEMSVTLRETLLSLGILSGLDPDEEDKLNDQVEAYYKKVDNKLNKLSSNNQQIKHLINEMRSPSQSSQENESNVIDGVNFL